MIIFCGLLADDEFDAGCESESDCVDVFPEAAMEAVVPESESKLQGPEATVRRALFFKFWMSLAHDAYSK